MINQKEACSMSSGYNRSVNIKQTSVYFSSILKLLPLVDPKWKSQNIDRPRNECARSNTTVFVNPSRKWNESELDVEWLYNNHIIKTGMM